MAIHVRYDGYEEVSPININIDQLHRLKRLIWTESTEQIPHTAAGFFCSYLAFRRRLLCSTVTAVSVALPQ